MREVAVRDPVAVEAVAVEGDAENVDLAGSSPRGEDADGTAVGKVDDGFVKAWGA